MPTRNIAQFSCLPYCVLGSYNYSSINRHKMADSAKACSVMFGHNHNGCSVAELVEHLKCVFFLNLSFCIQTNLQTSILILRSNIWFTITVVPKQCVYERILWKSSDWSHQLGVCVQQFNAEHEPNCTQFEPRVAIRSAFAKIASPIFLVSLTHNSCKEFGEFHVIP